MAENKRLYGSIVALVTPFDQNGELDLSALDKLIEFHMNNGTSAILLAGTTGEGPNITDDELGTILLRARSRAGEEFTLIAGSGTNSTSTTLKRTIIAQESGADFALIVGPYYNKPTQEGFYQHFKAISEGVDIPIIIYNVPGRTGSNIKPETVARLAEEPGIVAIKEASGDLEQIKEVLSIMPSEKVVLSGDDALTLPIIAMGGTGVISVVANEAPRETADMVQFAANGKIEEAGRLHDKLSPLMEVNFIESNPIPVKYALSKMGLISEVYRLPMVQLEEKNKKKIDEILLSIGIVNEND
ncbi:MAG: 4-hydroxy-tetrahydrodipicolinate synthase [Candidatus Marinimicrobia bacterium]|nr:4-hydroxy-tetrahydrodipicolinate synthase [Candidatus Neomarinimicrobiota bacterium]